MIPSNTPEICGVNNWRIEQWSGICYRKETVQLPGANHVLFDNDKFPEAWKMHQPDE